MAKRRKAAEIEEVKVEESKPVKNEKNPEIKEEQPKPKKVKVIPHW